MADVPSPTTVLLHPPTGTASFDTFGRILRLHEAGHAVFHAILAGTSCLEIQVGGPTVYEEGRTFSWAEPAPLFPLVRAVAALAGPVVNVISPQVQPLDDRLRLWRGTLGDYEIAFALDGQDKILFKAWDIAVELVLAFKSSIDVVASELAQRGRMVGAEVDEIVRTYPPERQLSKEVLDLLKTEFKERGPKTT